MILCVFSKILRQFGNDIRGALFAMYCQSICIFWINWFVFILYPVPFVRAHLYWYAYVIQNCWGNWLKTFNFRLLHKWSIAITKDAKHSSKKTYEIAQTDIYRKTLPKAQGTQGKEYFDSFNTFSSKQKLQQALNSRSNFSLVLFGKGREILRTTLTSPGNILDKTMQ